jgi:hypothetical protein
MPLAANALTSLAAVKEYLQIDSTDTSQNSLLDFLINSASMAIESYCRRKIKDVSYADEEYDGSGTRNLNLRQFPVSSITSIKIDDVALDISEYKFKKSSGIVNRLKALWPKEFQNIKVSYTAGYSSVPADIELACKHLVKFYYKTDVADFSTTFGEGVVMRPEAWPKQVKALLSSYRKVLI